MVGDGARNRNECGRPVPKSRFQWTRGRHARRCSMVFGDGDKTMRAMLRTRIIILIHAGLFSLVACGPSFRPTVGGPTETRLFDLAKQEGRESYIRERWVRLAIECDEGRFGSCDSLSLSMSNEACDSRNVALLSEAISEAKRITARQPAPLARMNGTVNN